MSLFVPSFLKKNHVTVCQAISSTSELPFGSFHALYFS
uniref:Uncharacterized protein n=1 Tax=Arundo donax TaxID=35708 RepID=A0A0A9CBL8_ARUDO